MYLKGGLHIDLSEKAELLAILVLVGIVFMLFYKDTHTVDSAAIDMVIRAAKSLAGGLS